MTHCVRGADQAHHVLSSKNDQTEAVLRGCLCPLSSEEDALSQPFEEFHLRLFS